MTCLLSDKIATGVYVSLIWDYFFFFSSRRRHTRLVSDWSSDVCSSDLDTDRIERLAVEPPDARAVIERLHREAFYPIRVEPHAERRRLGGFTLSPNRRVGQIGRASCRERV